MKKFARFLSLALVAVMLCATLASCATPAKDPKDAAAALKENGYTVTAEGEKLVSAIKGDEHITISYCDDKDTATKAYDEAVAAKEKTQEKLDEAEKELKDAKDELADMEDGFEKTVKQGVVDTLQKGVDELNKLLDVEIGKSGTMVWVGTKQAVKDAK